MMNTTIRADRLTIGGRIAICAALAMLAACTGISPSRVTTDRMEYGQVVAESWKRQTLLNVVRLRYADAPVFLEVASIINSYTVAGSANAQAQLPSGGTAPDVFSVGGSGNWSNTPTVTYQPLIGDRFTRSLLQPIPPVAVFQLMQGGWPVNLVFETVLASVNGLRNAASGVAADPGFDELGERLSSIQRAGNIGIRIDPRKDGGGVIAVIRNDKSGATPGEDSLRVRELLGLPIESNEFEISYGLIPRNRNEVAILTRSMMEIMLQLGAGIDLPATHATDGKATPGQWSPGNEKAKTLVRIRSGSTAPADAYAAVPFRGHWYWIDYNDIASKRVFTFMMILFSLAETGQSTSSPVVTVPSR